MDKFSLGIDLCVAGEDYKGGVARYSLAVTRAIIENSEVFCSRVSLICTKRNAEYIKRELGDLKYDIIINKNFGSIYYEKLHSLSYRLHFIPDFFFTIKALTSQSIKKQTSKLDLIYCPTTYLNFECKSISVVSLHDTQEVALPENFTKRQRNYRKLNRAFTLRHANVIQVSSEFVRKEINELTEFKRKDQKIHVIREGVDTSFFTFNPRSNILESSILIAVPANFTVHKNQRLIIEKLSSLNLDLGIKVLFIGEGQQMEECRKLAALKTSQNIEFCFVGKISDQILKEIYTSSHIVLTASSYESSSLPILEALSCGIIAVASNIDAHLEMSKRYPIYIFDLESANGLVDCIQGIIQGIEPLLSTKSRLRMRNSVVDSDWNQIATEYMEIFQSQELL